MKTTADAAMSIQSNPLHFNHRQNNKDHQTSTTFRMLYHHSIKGRKTGRQTFFCIFVAGPHWWAGSGPRAHG